MHSLHMTLQFLLRWKTFFTLVTIILIIFMNTLDVCFQMSLVEKLLHDCFWHVFSIDYMKKSSRYNCHSCKEIEWSHERFLYVLSVLSYIQSFCHICHNHIELYHEHFGYEASKLSSMCNFCRSGHIRIEHSYGYFGCADASLALF